MEKLERFVAGRTYGAVHTANQAGLRRQFELAAASYKGAEKLPGKGAASAEKAGKNVKNSRKKSAKTGGTINEKN